jgi:serine/threonine protein kinase
VNRDVEPLKPTDPKSFGGWKIKGRLGEGGYSTIFLGEKNGQLAAVKMIRRELLNDSKVFERFATEINNLERINHPGIAKIIESDLSTDVPYIAIEYIDGKTLQQKVDESGKLRETEWLDCLTQVAAALDYCHKIAITHKDVSPGNIILSQEGPKLIDFGISYHEGDQRVTQIDETVGTPAYMSPEHWDSKPRSEMDIFSLGSTFTFAGTGHLAFIGESKQEIREAIWRINPNLEGLSKTQINLLTPLLYKDFKDRPNLSELLEAVTKLRENPRLSVFETYLKNSDEKLIKSPNYSVKVSKSYKFATFGLIIVLATIGYFVSTNVTGVSESTTPELVSPSLVSTAQPSPVSEGSPTTASKDSNFATIEEKCINLVNSDRLEEALPSCQSAADLGSSKAQHNLGFIFDKELNNYETARYWYEIAGANGEAMSYFNLGASELYVNRDKSLNYFKKCSDLKLAQCTFNVANMYENDKRLDLAKKWYEKAIAQGDGGSARNLGNIYTNETDWNAAKTAYLKGAKLNDYISQYNYGLNLWFQFSEKTKACVQFKKAFSNSNSTYNPALEAFVEKCKNREWSISEEVVSGDLSKAPYRSINIDYHPGSWVIAGGDGELNKPAVTYYVQSRTQGSNQIWQYRFYLRINHTNGPAFIVKGDHKLPSECLEFRIVGEKEENVISQVWTLPKSSCKNNLDYYKLLAEKVEVSGNIPSEITPKNLDGLPFLSTETNQWIIPIDKLDGTGPVIVGQINLLVDKSKDTWLRLPYTQLSKQGKRNYVSVDSILVNGRCPQFRILEIESAKAIGVWLKPLPLECGT